MRLVFSMLLIASSVLAVPYEDWYAQQTDQDIIRARERWTDLITVRTTNCPPNHTPIYSYTEISPTQIIESVTCVPFVEPPPFAEQDALLDLMIPVLEIHPDVSDLPPDGLMYRLVEGTNYTWWVVRQGDAVATQLSSHDSDKRPIIRSRDLSTGIETMYRVDEIDARTATTNVTATIKDALRVSRTNLANIVDSISTNINQAQAVTVFTTSSTAQVRSAVIDIRREQVDMAQESRRLAREVQILRRALMRYMREDDGE